MTATVHGTADVRRAIERAWDRLGEDPLPPEHLDALAHAAEVQMPNGQADIEVLRADVERLFNERLKLEEQAGEMAEEIERLRAAPGDEVELQRMRRQLSESAAAEISARAERDKAREQLQDARIELVEAKQRPAGTADTARLASDLADDLADEQREIERLGRVHTELLGKIRDLEAVGAASAQELQRRFAVIEQLRDELEARPKEWVTEHRHAWELDPESGRFLDCSCELPYPRDLIDVEDDDQSTVAEPLDEFMQQLRQELDGWPDTDDGRCPIGCGAVSNTCACEAEESIPIDKPHGRTPAKCGTESGYRRHRDNGEDACRDCKQAVAAAAKRRKAAKKARAEAGEPT